MAKVSPIQNVFEGEFSPLAAGRIDLERYARSMRYMLNTVPCRTGPAIGRSGTYFEAPCTEITAASRLLPFVYNEEETLALEFSHFKLRFLYEYQGVACNREYDATAIVTISPFKMTLPGHDWEVGESVVFRDFAGSRNINNRFTKITAVSGDDVTFDLTGIGGSTGALSGSEQGSVIYEIVTPYHRNDVKNLRYAQFLNVVYLFCFKSDGSGDYPPYILKRFDTFNWTITQFPKGDGPYLPINTTTTHFVPTNKGTWVPDMTGATTPSGQAAASSQVTGHEAWKAFDGDIDTYWEGKTAQEGWLEYNFNTAFLNSLPDFTAATTGGMTISTSSGVVGNEGWRAADRDNETDWRSSGNLTQYWQIDLGAAQTVREYKIRASKNKEEFAPRDFTLEGASASGGPYTVVDTRTGITWNSGQSRHFTVGSPASFRYYRIIVTKVNRRNITTVIPAVGKKGKKGYVPKKTVTTKTDNRAGFAEVQFSYANGIPRVVDGYTIYLGRYAKGKEVKDHAPKTFYFEGWDGDSWKILDSQQGYEEWKEYRSEYFEIQNDEAFIKYRLRIKTVQKNGDVTPRIGKLVMSSPDPPLVTLRASSKVGINENRGFLPTDVGRIIRLQDADNRWRWLTITAVTDETRISCDLAGADPIVLDKRVQFWRLGLWSDTTGWPTCGSIYEDRLCVAGASGNPDTVVGSRTGQHTKFVQTSGAGVVLDTHAFVVRANSRFMSHIEWIKASEAALRFGTGVQEFVLTTPVDEALTARNVKIRPITKRGSYEAEPVDVGSDVVFIHKSGRAIYASQYQSATVENPEAYTAPLMSKLGAHLLEPKVVQIVYQQEPHGLIWGRREDGSIVAMTYNPDDDIFGGHRHDFSGIVHDIMAIYSPTDKQDSLWLVIERTIGGVSKFYIERMYRFWDYGDILTEDATFVDSALRYYGNTLTDKVYGLNHLEGRYLDVLADRIVYRAVGPVTAGVLTLPRQALDIVVGLGYVREGEIAAPEAGAEDGTAQGKSKRPHTVVLSLWESARGEVGRWNEDQNVKEWTPVEYKFPQDASIPEATLRTCMTGATVLPGGYGQLGTVAFRQLDPLPFNIVQVLPQMFTSDDR